MTLVHWSPEPFALDVDREYSQAGMHNMKPRGLWLSDESDHGWKAWCESENWNLAGLKYFTELELTDSANILVISTAAELRAFTQAYGFVKYESHHINWQRVSQGYGGILITPYQWSCRWDDGTDWYYGWDVASACIWDLNAIALVKESVLS